VTDQAPLDIGAMVAPLIAALPHGTWPRLLAMLERVAGDRYRQWASEAPAHADVFLACAAREDSVADRVAAVWHVPESAIEQMTAMLPGATAAYAGMFAGRSLRAQLELQAAAELQGEAAWQAIADGVTDADTVSELHTCAALERESAEALQSVIAAIR